MTYKSELILGTSRGQADLGWLKSWHSFSFSEYFDRNRMHFGVLRVLNDDDIAPGRGFGEHPHDNMEIVTIPLTGQLAHKDSMGNASIIKSGEVQVMSAGKGIFHSEFNASKTEPVTLLQIWVIPQSRDVTPRYDQASYLDRLQPNQWVYLVSPLDKLLEGSVGVHQDAYFAMGQLTATDTISYACHGSGQLIYVFVIEGGVSVDNVRLSRRDALAITAATRIEINAAIDSKVLVIEVPTLN